MNNVEREDVIDVLATEINKYLNDLEDVRTIKCIGIYLIRE